MINWHKENYYKTVLGDMTVWSFPNGRYALESSSHVYYALADDNSVDILQYRSIDSDMLGILFIFEPKRIKK